MKSMREQTFARKLDSILCILDAPLYKVYKSKQGKNVVFKRTKHVSEEDGYIELAERTYKARNDLQPIKRGKEIKNQLKIAKVDKRRAKVKPS